MAPVDQNLRNLTMAFFRRPSRLSATSLSWILLSLCFQFGTTANISSAWPVHDNGLQHSIKWDHYSLLINDERLFLFGGEMHPFRLPVPELWEDILQKIKAMGMRMVSIYTHWGFHAPTSDTVDFGSGPHNLTRFFQMAKDVGLYVMVRPGPYINGELSAGGMALWATTGAYGTLRSNGTAYTKAWTPYQDGIARAANPFQLTEGGTVIMYQIENEYGNQWKDVKNKLPNPAPISYMEKLEANARANGIVVPLTHNMPNQNGAAWSKDYDTVDAGGDVDIYGLDSYVSARILLQTYNLAPTNLRVSHNAGPACSPSAAPSPPGPCQTISTISKQFPRPNRPSCPNSKAVP